MARIHRESEHLTAAHDISILGGLSHFIAKWWHVRTAAFLVALFAASSLQVSGQGGDPQPSTPVARPSADVSRPQQQPSGTVPTVSVPPRSAEGTRDAVTGTAQRAVTQAATDTLTVRLVQSNGRDWTPVIIALVSIAASVLATMITARQKNKELAQTLVLKQKELDQALSLKQQELDRTLGLRLGEQERAELARRLTTFYGPLKQHLTLARVLHDRLREGDSEHRKREEFRTLVALLRGDDFSENDLAIINELVATTSAARQLIMSSEGIVEDEALLATLSKAAAHFRLLELAAAKKIIGEVSRFESSTFPRELDEMVELAIRQLRSRLQDLAKA